MSETGTHVRRRVSKRFFQCVSAFDPHASWILLNGKNTITDDLMKVHMGNVLSRGEQEFYI